MRALWLPKVLRDAGLTVHEVSGWKTRGSDSFGPIVGVTIHETRGSRTSSDAGEIRVLVEGRPGLSGPIAQLYLSRDGDWHVVASGRANHNKTGFAGPNKGYGNSNLLGIEAQHAEGEPWTDRQYSSYVKGTAAIARHLNLSVSRVAGHKEHQPGEKSDPSFSMSTFRRNVTEALSGKDDDMPLTPADKPILIEAFQEALQAKLRLPRPIDQRMAALGASYGPDVAPWTMFARLFEPAVRESLGLTPDRDVNEQEIVQGVLAGLGKQNLDVLVDILDAAGVDKAALAAKLTAR